MRIGITLNDVVRDFSGAFAESYDDFIAFDTSNPELAKADLSATPLDATGNFTINTIENRERKLLNLSEVDDLIQLTSKYSFEDLDEYLSFVYEESAFSIFARCNLMYDEAMQDLNELYNTLIENPKHTVTVVSQERKNSKQATLLFLAQNKFTGNNIKFLYNYSNIWEIFDLVVTADPFIINSKPTDKMCFKIETDYNLECEADSSFKSLFELHEFIKENAN